MNPLLNILALGAPQLQNLQTNPEIGPTDAGGVASGTLPPAVGSAGSTPFAAMILSMVGGDPQAMQSLNMPGNASPNQAQNLQDPTLNWKQIEQLLNQLPERMLLNIYQQLFAGVQSGLGTSDVEQQSTASAASGQTQVETAVDLLQQLTSKPAGAWLASEQQPQAVNDKMLLEKMLAMATAAPVAEDASPLIKATVKLDSNLLAQLSAPNNQLSPQDALALSRPELVAAIKNALTNLSEQEPQIAHKLVDHLQQLFPNLKVDKADMTISASQEVSDNPKPMSDAIQQSLQPQSDKSVLHQISELAQFGAQTKTAIQQPLIKPQLSTQTNVVAQPLTLNTEEPATPEAKAASDAAKPIVAQPNASEVVTAEQFKLMAAADKETKDTNLQFGDGSQKSHTAIKSDQPLPVRATTPASNMEDFRMILRRSHINTLLSRGEVKLQLHPEHLGAVKIDLVSDHSEMTARVQASSHDARHVIEHNLPQLRESFAKLGLRLGQIDVTVGDDRLFQQHERSEQTQFDKSKQSSSMAQSEQVEATPAALPRSAPLYAGGLNLLA